ncbi:MAG TPA: SDR family oxidoreductase [Polyangiaceae bacterium]|nr:SDR family oxidoreductase [Polyangiaceae bacterium]
MVASRHVATALITGASAGIGRELARLFAAAGHDLLLVARRLPELRALCSDLEQRHRVKARAVACDLSSQVELDALLAEVRGVELDFLVNNAGIGTPGAFAELPAAGESALIEVNVRALVRLTREILPGMLARRRGRVLNMGSMAGFQPGPYMATYYASKAFVISFSEALAYETRGTGVTVTVSCPGPTLTEFGAHSDLYQSRLFQFGTARAEGIARQAFRAMERGRPLVVHGPMNFLLLQSLRIAPRAWLRALTAWLNRAPVAKST